MSSNDVSVVLVHGAWADGSSWAKIIGPLAAEGLNVVGGAAAADLVPGRCRGARSRPGAAPGPVVLVGHAYAGAVIAATRSEKVKALVYVAALAPGRGRDRRGRLLPRRAASAGAEARARRSRADLSARGGLRLRLRAERRRGRARRAGGGAAADLARLHHRRRAAPVVEGPAGLVPGGRAGSHDRRGQSALHGRAHEGPDALACGRPHADRDRAGCRPGRASARRSLRSKPSAPRKRRRGSTGVGASATVTAFIPLTRLQMQQEIPHDRHRLSNRRRGRLQDLLSRGRRRRTRRSCCCCMASRAPATCSAISSRCWPTASTSIAPDLPGFGNSDMPGRGATASSRSPTTIDRFTEVVGFDRYAVYVFDYGAPTGFRLAVKHPDRITAIISQNGNAYEEG